MEINGLKIADVRTYSIEGMEMVIREGRKMLKSSPDQVDKTEEALIIAAEYAVQYEKIAKKEKKLPKKASAILTSPDNIAYAAVMDYLKSKKYTSDIKHLKRLIVDKVASAVFFLMYDACNNEFYQESGEKEWLYDTVMILDYGFDIASGGEHFRKLGFRVVSPDNPADVEYFDALETAKKFVENELIDLGEVAVADSPHFTYRVNLGFDRCRHYQGEPDPEPVPLKDELKKNPNAAANLNKFIQEKAHGNK